MCVCRIRTRMSAVIQTLEDVKKEFERHGTIKSCRLVRDIGRRRHSVRCMHASVCGACDSTTSVG